MDTLRANEKLVEVHGPSAEVSGGVKDWQADRLAQSLAKMDALFSQALALQEKQGPVSADLAHQVTTTMTDLRTIAGHDAQSMQVIRGYADRFNDSAESLKLAENSKAPVAALALLARNEFVRNDYYGVSADACGSAPALERLCERSRAIVGAGYIHERDLDGVRVAVTSLESANASVAKSFQVLAEKSYGSFLPTASVESESYFAPDPAAPRIVINENQSKGIRPDRPEPVVDTFSHEIGHWLNRDKSATLLQAGAEQLRAAGGANAVAVDKLLPRESLTPDNLLKEGRGIIGQEMWRVSDGTSVRWLHMVKEMQGDIMSIAAEHAEFGRPAALALSANIVAMRDKERLDGLQADTIALRQGPEDVRGVRFAEEHHTSTAVREFAARIQAGDLDKVRTPEQFDRLMGETLASAVVKQYEQVRTAELNVHHIENGKVVPGLPAGVDMKDVLAAEIAANLRHPAGTPTVLITAEESKRLPPDAQVAALNVAGRLPSGDEAKFQLSTRAPEGLSMPVVQKGTVNVGGFDIDNRMAGFAKEVVSQGEAFGKSLENSATKSLSQPASPGALGAAAELGSQAQQGQQKLQEKASAESAPKAVEMAM